MRSFKESFPKIHGIFSPGYATEHIDHPLLKNLNHPIFKRIIRFSDQAVILMNQSTFSYDYVTENIKDFTGYEASEVQSKGALFGFSLMHPDDLAQLENMAFVAFNDCFNSLSSDSEKLKIRFSYTYRIRKANGTYIPVLQHSIPLSIENNKVLLSLLVITDISAFKTYAHVAFKTILINETSTTILFQGNCAKSVFSEREVNVLELTANGVSEKQIAEKLGVSINTIKTHRRNMIKKAGVKNAAELIRYGVANLLI